MDKPRYFKCSKCGESIRKILHPSLSDLDNMPVCIFPMVERTSGICGGSFSVEITEEEYNETLKEWENKNAK
jgi:hypothetical protein